MKGKITYFILLLLFTISFLIFGVSTLNSSCGIWVSCASGGLAWCEVFGYCSYGEFCGETWLAPGVICGCKTGPEDTEWTWGIYYCQN